MKPDIILRHHYNIQTICFIENSNIISNSSEIHESENQIKYDDDISTIFLLSGDVNGAIVMWDLFTRRKICTIDNAHLGDHGVYHIDTCHDTRNKIISQGRDGVLRLWQINNDTISDTTRQIDSENSGFCKFDTFGDLLITSGDDPNELFLFEISNPSQPGRKLSPPTQSKTGMCMCVKFARVSNLALWILALFENGTLYIYDMTENDWIENLQLTLHKNVPIAMDIIVVSKKDTVKINGVSCGSDDQINAFTINTATCISKLLTTIKPNQIDQGNMNKSGFSCIKIRGDCRIFAVSRWDGSILVYDWRKLTLLAKLRTNGATVNNIAFSLDHTQLASASDDKQVAIWTLYPPKTVLKAL